MDTKNKEVQSEPRQELTVQDRAIAALGLAELRESLTELATKSKDLVAISNEDAYQQIHSARMVLKNERLDITRKAKAARDDANAFSKAVIAEEKSLIDIIAPEEDRLQALQKDHDERAERERQEKIEAEVKRVEGIQERIVELRGAIAAVNSMGLPSSEKVIDFIDDIQKIVVDSSFDEFEPQAHEAKASTLAMLREILTAANERKAEENRIAAERKELAELRAADEKRRAEEQAKREAEEAEAKKVRDAEDKKKREDFEAQRKKQEKEQAKIDAENKRLDAEKAIFERKQKAEADRKAAEKLADEKRKSDALAAAKKAKYPGDEAIINALAEYFEVPAQVAMSWVTAIRKAA